MIYITGDTHGDKDLIERFAPAGEMPLGTGDCLMICGDFGFLFENNKEENDRLDAFEKLPFEILFIDGNHENFPALFSYPEELWQGGRVHRIRKNIRHLMRGQVFTIEGKRFYTMGGAYSVDRSHRRLGEGYWQEEIPSDADYKESIKNLTANGMRVDYVITHTAPRDLFYWIGYHPDPHDAELTGHLEWIEHDVGYTAWFFGHFHEDRDFGNGIRMLLHDVVKIG